MSEEIKQKTSLKTILKIFSYSPDAKWLWILAIALIAATSIARAVGVSFIQVVVDKYLVPLTNNFSGELSSSFKTAVLLMGAVYLAAALSNYAYMRIIVLLEANLLQNFRKKLFSRMMVLPLNYFHTHKVGSLMGLYTNDIDAIRQMVNTSLPTLIYALLNILSIVYVMFYYSWKLTIFILAFMTFIVWLNRKIVNSAKNCFREQQTLRGQMNGLVEELASGQKVIKMCNHEKQAEEEFSEVNEALSKVSVKANFYYMVLMPIMINCADIVYTIIVIVGAVLALQNKISLGTVLAFSQYTRTLIHPITEIIQQLNSVFSALAGGERVLNVIEKSPEIDNGTIYLKDNQWYSGDNKLKTLKGEVEFRNVAFGYKAEKEVLNNISFSAKKGEKIAFVGATGAGKTTIINLMARFYDVEKGEIFMDGLNINNIKKESIRNLIAMVPQDVNLFTGSIIDNIRYGNEEARLEQIKEAGRLANLEDFVENLPDKWDTIIKGNADNLSQGQKQLIAIARAIVANRPILILDEATSSIDSGMEELITKALEKLMENKTVFIIAHRLSTVRNCNNILVLENGRVMESGNHEALIEADGIYKKLYETMLKFDD